MGPCARLNLGLNHRRALPPFLLVQQNQDGVFASLVKACCDDTFFGFLPWLISHEPRQPRRLTDDDLVGAAAGVRSDRVVQLLIRAAAGGRGGTFDENLTAVGGLGELAALPEGWFGEAVRGVVREQIGGLARRLSDRLGRYGGQPEWWATDVRRVLATLRARLAEPDLIMPDAPSPGLRDHRGALGSAVAGGPLRPPPAVLAGDGRGGPRPPRLGRTARGAP